MVELTMLWSEHLTQVGKFMTYISPLLPVTAGKQLSQHFVLVNTVVILSDLNQFPCLASDISKPTPLVFSCGYILAPLIGTNFFNSLLLPHNKPA